MSWKILAVLLLVAVSGCCGSREEAPAKVMSEQQKAPLSHADQMRQKAKIAEAASLVGYDGKAIRRDLDKIIDQQEESAKQLEALKDL